MSNVPAFRFRRGSPEGDGLLSFSNKSPAQRVLFEKEEGAADSGVFASHAGGNGADKASSDAVPLWFVSFLPFSFQTKEKGTSGGMTASDAVKRAVTKEKRPER